MKIRAFKPFFSKKEEKMFVSLHEFRVLIFVLLPKTRKVWFGGENIRRYFLFFFFCVFLVLGLSLLCFFFC